MKKSKRRPSPGITYRMAQKRLVDHQCLPTASVLIDRVFDRRLGRFRDARPTDQIEENFYLEPEDGPPPSEGDRPEAAMAVVGAAFEAATSQDQRHELHRCQALCAIIQPSTPAWAGPLSTYFRTVFGDRWVHRVNYGTDQTDFQDRTGSHAVSRALAAGQSVVGISADVNLLPRTLVGAADLMIRLMPPNSIVVKAAIARFASRASVELEDLIVAGLDLDDIVAAFRPGAGPQRIAQRLAAAAAALRVNRDLRREKHPCLS